MPQAVGLLAPSCSHRKALKTFDRVRIARDKFDQGGGQGTDLPTLFPFLHSTRTNVQHFGPNRLRDIELIPGRDEELRVGLPLDLRRGDDVGPQGQFSFTMCLHRFDPFHEFSKEISLGCLFSAHFSFFLFRAARSASNARLNWSLSFLLKSDASLLSYKVSSQKSRSCKKQ